MTGAVMRVHRQVALVTLVLVGTTEVHCYISMHLEIREVEVTARHLTTGKIKAHARAFLLIEGDTVTGRCFPTPQKSNGFLR